MASGWPAAVEYSCCPFNHCLCIWRRECPPSTPRVAPGMDYACIPAGGADDDDDDDSPAAWSVLVGVKAGVRVTSLGLYRFGVARSGRVLGRSGDALEVVVDDLAYKAKRTNSSSVHAAAATRSSDGRSLSLCLFSRERDFSSDNFESTLPGTARPLQLNLAAADDRGVIAGVSALPGLPIGPRVPVCPVSVAVELWAPYLTGINGPFDLVMQRLDEVAGRWVEVARFSSPEGFEIHREQRNIPVLQGVAVVHDTILLSLFPCHLFFTFNCSTLVWKAVVNYQKTQPFTPLYTPINGRGVYVEEDDTIYFIHGHSLYSYKLCFAQNRQQHSMMPPTRVARLSPFRKGNGFVAHLGNRVLCSVWIGEKFDEDFGCDCDTEHVLITTFRVKGGGCKKQFVPKGIDVLHSTCRRLDRSPTKLSEPHCKFCFLQEYEEFSHENATPSEKAQRGNVTAPAMLQEAMVVPVSSNVVEPIACCREFLNGSPSSRVFILDECSAIQINQALYIVCQTAAFSTVVYRINVLDGRLTCQGKTVTPHCTLETDMCHDEKALMNRSRPLPWHFVCDPTHILAIGHIDNRLYACSLRDDGKLLRFTSTRPTGVEFQLVIRVGHKILALTDNLQCVYRLSQIGEWICCKTSVPLPYLGKKVNLSGYVVLTVDSFMVSDADSGCCFLLDLQCNGWNVVKPDVHTSLQNVLPTKAFLCERSLFVNGFIYTCTTEGLAAYELIEEGDSHCLGDGIFLKFSWNRNWERYRMCFEYVGKDTNSGSIMFCVLQDFETCVDDCPYNTRPVCITTVQVKTEGMPNGNLKPMAICHVDIGTFFVEWSESEIVFWTRNCFAAAPFSWLL